MTLASLSFLSWCKELQHAKLGSKPFSVSCSAWFAEPASLTTQRPWSSTAKIGQRVQWFIFMHIVVLTGRCGNQNFSKLISSDRNGRAMVIPRT